MMRLVEFIQEAKRLRSLANEAEQKLMRFCLEHEDDHEMVADLIGTGETFVSMLDRERIVDAGRYLRWKKAVGALGGKTADAPVEAVVAAGGLDEPRAMANVVERGVRYLATNGAPPAERTAREYAKEERVRIAANKEPGGFLSAAEKLDAARKRIAELEAKNAALLAEVKAGRKRIAELEAELKSSRKQKPEPAEAAE